MSVTTRAMSDAHEQYLVAMLGGRMTKGSGNQWHNPMDGRQDPNKQYYAFAWDGKSTLGKSIGVSRSMWEKAREQALPAKPLLPLRWYDTERLDVGLDLVVLSLTDFALILADANRFQAAREEGCLLGRHTWGPNDLGLPNSECHVCGADMVDVS